MNKAIKLFNHFTRGTIFRRLEYEKVKKNAIQKEKAWNDFLNSDQKEIVIQITNGSILKLYKDSSLSPHLFKGDFEFHEIKFILTFLEKGDVFIDIGANIGYFSITASSSVGETGAVHCFEPTEQTYSRLLGSIALNNAKNIFPHATALSNLNEERAFTVSTNGFDAYNSLGTPSEGEGFSKKILFTRSLDSFLKEENIADPSLIKIDVEGWEIPVIEGMKELLAKKTAPVLIVEFTESNAKSAGFSCSSLFDMITELNYNLYKYNWINNTLTKQTRQENY